MKYLKFLIYIVMLSCSGCSYYVGYVPPQPAYTQPIYYPRYSYPVYDSNTGEYYYRSW